MWQELWNELHHQGDVGETSYVAVPHLVRIASASAARDWNIYALASTIEVERHRRSNPRLPSWLADAYAEAWRHLLALALEDIPTTSDPDMLRSILGTIAIARGHLKLGAWIRDGDDETIAHDLEEHRAWSEEFAPRSEET